MQARSFSREQATWRKSTNQSLAGSGVCFLSDDEPKVDLIKVYNYTMSQIASLCEASKKWSL